MLRLMCSAAFVALGTAAQAITYGIDTYYWISGPATIRNDNPYPISDHEPFLDIGAPITGIIQVDRKAAPDSNLANMVVSYDAFGGGDYPDDWASDVLQTDEFSCCGRDAGYFWSMSFDDFGQLRDFSFTSLGRSVDGGEDWWITNGGAHLFRDPYPQSIYVNEFAHSFLTDLGYKRGTEAYAQLYCGSWVSERTADTCLRNQEAGLYPGEASGSWGTLLQTGPGTIYASFTQFTAAYRAALAAPQPPVRSYADIAPVPVPAPLLMLIGGLFGLCLVGHSRKRSGTTSADTPPCGDHRLADVA